MGVPIEERDLIRQILSGDTDAYAEIVRANQGKVMGLCLSLLRNPVEAEDAAQEIFIKAYQSLNSFKGNSSLSTWLYRISSNHCKDLLRKKGRQKTESLDALLEASGDGVQRISEPSFNPAATAEASDIVERLLAALSPEERLILTLREAQGLSYQEIAQTLQCTLDAVKARLRRARQAAGEKFDTFRLSKTSKLQEKR